MASQEKLARPLEILYIRNSSEIQELLVIPHEDRQTTASPPSFFSRGVGKQGDLKMKNVL